VQTETEIQSRRIDCQPELLAKRRRWLRPHFPLKALLFAPIVVTMLLFIAVPKLLTGDFVEITVTSIKEDGRGFLIEMDAWVSSGTGFGIDTDYGPFSQMGITNKRLRHWTRLISTWPEHYLVTIDLRVNRDKLPKAMGDPISMVRVTEGESVRGKVGEPIAVAFGKSVDGEQGKCVLEVSRGSRLGL
jgi:hypothetical protein